MNAGKIGKPNSGIPLHIFSKEEILENQNNVHYSLSIDIEQDFEHLHTEYINFTNMYI